MSPADGPAYLDRTAPVSAPAKFRVLAFSTGPLIELDCGSNCPGRIVGPGRSAAAWRFLIFCAALAFARWRALAFVMGSVPFRVAGGSLAVSWPDVLITNVTGETDLQERRIAVLGPVRPLMREWPIGAFVAHYNNRRYHESLGNLTPADVYFGRGHAILSERRKIKEQTLKQRRLINQRQAA